MGMTKYRRNGTVLSKILHALDGAPNGLLTTELVEPAGYGGTPSQRALSKVGTTLRRAGDDRLVCHVDSSPGGWQRCPIYRWRITPEGRALLAWWATDAVRTTARMQARAAARAQTQQRRDEREAAMAAARKEYGGRRLPRWERQPVAKRLHDEGLSLRQIGSVFGVSAELIRLDLASPQYPPYRQPRGLRALEDTPLAGLTLATYTDWT